MPLSKGRFLTVFIIVILIVSVSIVIIAKHSSAESSPLEKIGKIKHIDYWEWWEPNKPPVTILVFEDGDILYFERMIENIEIGKTYHIIYHKQHEHFAGEWSGEYYITDSIEEVE